MSTGEALPFQSEPAVVIPPLLTDIADQTFDIELHFDATPEAGDVYRFRVRTIFADGSDRSGAGGTGLTGVVPFIIISTTDDCGREVLIQDQCFNCADDTQTINGADYYYDWVIPASPLNRGYHVRVFDYAIDEIELLPDLLSQFASDQDNFMVGAIGGGGSGSLSVVQESDGSPAVTSVSELHFLQSDGFQVVDLGSGIAEVRFPDFPTHIADPSAHHVRYSNDEADARVESHGALFFNQILTIEESIISPVSITNPDTLLVDPADGYILSEPVTDTARLDFTPTATASHTHDHATLTNIQPDDHHDPVTLVGAPDYITLSGQEITRGLVSHADDITDILADDHHDPVTLGGGSDPALTLSGQELTLADVLTPAEGDALFLTEAEADALYNKIFTVRAVDGSPTVTNPTLLEFEELDRYELTLSSPDSMLFTFDTSALGTTIRVRESDDNPDFVAIDTLTFDKDGFIVLDNGPGDALIKNAAFDPDCTTDGAEVGA